MENTWAVWTRLPGYTGTLKTHDGAGWSRIAASLTETEAHWLANEIFFPSRAMQDAEPGHYYPVVATEPDNEGA